MKKWVLSFLSLSFFIAVNGQQIDKYADFYFYSAFNKQQQAIRADITADSAKTGFFLVTNIQIDTLNKNELKIMPPKKETAGSTINMNGVVVGVLPQSDDPGKKPSADYDFMTGAIAVHADTFKLMAISRTGFFRHTLFCGFTALIGKHAAMQARYFEESLDSTAIYRTTASPKKIPRVEVPAYISNAYINAWPGNVGRVYGRAVLMTDPFYVLDENFANKYILKRYTIDFVYRTFVHKIK